MKICLCLDKKRGMMFFGKRQSQDRIQRSEMLNLIGKNNLWISRYSSSLFETSDKIIVDDDYSKKASANDYCFVEDQDVELANCSTVIIYNWNRQYPADKFFVYDLKEQGFRLTSKRDFVGSSHEKITEEIYTRKEEQQ